MKKIAEFLDKKALDRQNNLKNTVTSRLKTQFVVQVYTFIFTLISFVALTIYLIMYYKSINWEVPSLIFFLFIYLGMLRLNLSSIEYMKRLRDTIKGKEINEKPENFLVKISKYMWILFIILVISLVVWFIVYIALADNDMTTKVIAIPFAGFILMALLKWLVDYIKEIKVSSSNSNARETISGMVHRFSDHDHNYLELIDSSGHIKYIGDSMLPILTYEQNLLLKDCTTGKRNAFVKITYIPYTVTIVDFEITEIPK